MYGKQLCDRCAVYPPGAGAKPAPVGGVASAPSPRARERMAERRRPSTVTLGPASQRGTRSRVGAIGPDPGMCFARLSPLGYECRKRRANPTSAAPPASSPAPMPSIGPVVLPVRGNSPVGVVVGETAVVDVVSWTVVLVVVEVVVEVVVVSSSTS